MNTGKGSEASKGSFRSGATVGISFRNAALRSQLTSARSRPPRCGRSTKLPSAQAQSPCCVQRSEP